MVLQAAEGVYSAREFVGWYNGLPEFSKVRVTATLLYDSTLIGTSLLR